MEAPPLRCGSSRRANCHLRRRLSCLYLNTALHLFSRCCGCVIHPLSIAIPGLKQAHHDLPENGQRSEEHTSELQSLMRISYAVFCLKKKNNTKHIQITR